METKDLTDFLYFKEKDLTVIYILVYDFNNYVKKIFNNYILFKKINNYIYIFIIKKITHICVGDQETIKRVKNFIIKKLGLKKEYLLLN